MHDAELRALYLGTTWSVRAPGGTLRLAPGSLAPRPLRPSAIVTAYNPFSRPATPAWNRAALRRLRARVAGARCFPSRAHGTGPHRLRWSEPGVALFERDHAILLAREFEQNAILVVDEAGRVSIVATRPGFCGREVGEAI